MAPSSIFQPQLDWLMDENYKIPEIKEFLLAQMVRGNFSRTYYFRRCKRIRWSLAESIPDEILFEILLRLPAQDLYYASRFVCRKWYHMVRTKNFVQKHLEHASYGLLYRDESGDVVFISAREDGGGIDTYKLNYNFRFTVWSSCNGLMLKYELPFRKLICYGVRNVSTDKALRLPPFPYYLVFKESSGVGYDAASMTYKVVVLYSDTGKGRLAILTVGVDKSWRTVCTDHLSLLGSGTKFNNPIITEGFMHWQKKSGTEMVTLNLETEIISETPPPIPKDVVLNTKCILMSTGRCLSLFIRRRKLVWEVYEMKQETGEWRMFTKICLEGETGRIERLGFKHDKVDIEPCGWLKYPEVLALRVQTFFIIFYNLVTCEIGSEKLSTHFFYCSVTLHKNSLVWF